MSTTFPGPNPVHINNYSRARRWRKLNGHQLIPDVVRGLLFVDGVKKDAA